MQQIKTCLIALVRCYQILVSPFLAPSCRFFPSCSQYMIQAIAVHGCIKGVYLGLRRLSKCHPYSNGGIDEVPHACGVMNSERSNEKCV